MHVEFAEELQEQLSLERTGLQIAAKYVSREEVLGGYMNRSFGNDYDFDQVDRVEGVF
jgi:hypothetical protein